MADASQGSAASVTTDVLPGDGSFRIALCHPDKDHHNSEVFSWRRLYAFNADYHDANYDPLAAARADVRAAKKEFPGHDAWVERLVDNGDGTHSWVPVEGTVS